MWASRWRLGWNHNTETARLGPKGNLVHRPCATWRQSMSAHPAESEALLTPSEVATLFRVDPKTVTRWAKAGKLSSIRTLGGHRRYRESEVRELLNGVPQPREGKA